ncbi:hypothetical protein [Actinomadura alba]|uniref:hypothetical protein n=1 Tax=Actinomadura alba TaxID=406431 RepID=UPI0031CE9809
MAFRSHPSRSPPWAPLLRTSAARSLFRRRHAPGRLAGRAATRHVIGGHHEEDFEIWDSGGALVAQSRRFALLR